MRRPTLRAVAFALCFALAAQAAEPPPSEPVNTNNALRQPGSLLDASGQRRHHLLSIYAGFPYSYWRGVYGFPLGVSLRYMLPLLHNGFVAELNDSLNLEFGADAAFFGGGPFGGFLAIPVELMWALHFVPRVAGYIKLGVALDFNFASYCYATNLCRTPWAPGAYPIGAIGGWYRFSDNLYIRIEAGYPWFKVGVALGF